MTRGVTPDTAHVSESSSQVAVGGWGRSRDEFDELEDAGDAQDAKDLDDADDPRVARHLCLCLPAAAAVLRDGRQAVRWDSDSEGLRGAESIKGPGGGPMSKPCGVEREISRSAAEGGKRSFEGGISTRPTRVNFTDR